MAFAEVVSRLDEPTVLRVAYGSSVPSENRVSMARAAARRVKRIQMAQQSEQNGEDFQDSAEAVNPLTTDSTFAPDDFLPTLPEADQAQLVETLTRPAAADAGKTDSLIGLEEDLQFDSSVPREVFPRGPPAVEETPIHIGGAESNDFADNDSANGFEQHPTSSAPIAREAINKADVLPLLETSIQQWRQLPSLADRTSHLDQVTFTIVDLPGEQLAETNGSHILIDATAANSGWYLDSTPFDHSEFDATSAALSATAASSATGQIDLLTVLNHELGHVIGLVHAEPVHGSDDLMVDHLAEANDGS